MTSTWINVDGERPSVLPVFCSPRCWVLLDWRPMAAVYNVSSQEARECCQGNELHGVTKRIIYSRMVGVFGGTGRTRWTITCFLLPFRIFGFGRVSLSKNATSRTEYSFQRTCSRTSAFCNIDSSGFAYRLVKCLEIASPMPQ